MARGSPGQFQEGGRRVEHGLIDLQRATRDHGLIDLRQRTPRVCDAAKRPATARRRASSALHCDSHKSSSQIHDRPTSGVFFAIVFVVIPTPIVPAKQGQTVPRRHGMFMGLTRPHWHWSHKCTPAADVRRWTTPPLPPTPCRVRVTGPSSPPPLPPPAEGG